MTGRVSIRHLVTATALAIAMAPFAAAQSSQTPAGSPAATATPRLADGRPDLTGTWDTGYFSVALPFVQPQKMAEGSVCVTGCAPVAGRGGPAPARAGGAGAAGRGAAGAAATPARNFPTYKPEYLARVKELDEQQVQHDSVLRCQAPGVPRIGPPHKIVQTPRELIFMYDDVNGGFFRIVKVGGTRRSGVPGSYLGDAVARWDADTLIVETANFNEDTWLTDNGAFHTKDLRVVERLRRVGNTIEYQATAHDPAVLAEPWNVPPRTLRLTDVELEESARCEDRSLPFMQDGTHHVNPR